MGNGPNCSAFWQSRARSFPAGRSLTPHHLYFFFGRFALLGISGRNRLAHNESSLFLSHSFWPCATRGLAFLEFALRMAILYRGSVMYGLPQKSCFWSDVPGPGPEEVG